MIAALRGVTLMRGRKIVLENADCEIPRGSVFGILGHRGAGKSSVIGLLAGTRHPQAGQVLRRGTVSPPIGSSALLSRRETVRNNVRFVARLHRIDANDAVRHVEATARLGMSLDYRLDELTAAERARLVYAISYSMPYDLYLADEQLAPTAPGIQARCLAMLRDRARDSSIVIATRSTAVLRRHCDCCALIEGRRLVTYPSLRSAILRFREIAEALPPPGADLGDME